MFTSHAVETNKALSLKTKKHNYTSITFLMLFAWITQSSNDRNDDQTAEVTRANLHITGVCKMMTIYEKTDCSLINIA